MAAWPSRRYAQRSPFSRFSEDGDRPIRLFSNDNAKFCLLKIVTSESKSCLMGFMGASYKFSK